MPEDIRVGYTMLKEANFIPAEVELLQEIARLEETLKTAEPGQQEQLRKQIQEKRLKYNILLDSIKKRRG
jgi:DNA-binding protein H-NS